MEAIQLSLSKGIYGLLKNHLKLNSNLSDFNKKKLEKELKTAKVLPNKSLPQDVVAINTTVQVRDMETKALLTFDLVAPDEAKVSNKKISVLSPIGVALLGYYVGNEVIWEMPEGLKTFKIEKVSEIG